jgi:hypothetical protein
MLRISSSAQLITTQQAAELFHVTPQTVTNWIRDGQVPYIELPSSGGGKKTYRLPLAALIQSLQGNYDLLPDIKVLDDAAGDVAPPSQ